MPSGDPENDAFVEVMLAEGSADALPWLADDAHEMIRSDKGADMNFAQALLDAGARRVLVAKFTDVGDGATVAETMVIELPADPAIRQRVFECGAAQLWKQGPRPKNPERWGLGEAGQKYIEWGFL